MRSNHPSRSEDGAIIEQHVKSRGIRSVAEQQEAIESAREAHRMFMGSLRVRVLR